MWRVESVAVWSLAAMALVATARAGASDRVTDTAALSATTTGMAYTTTSTACPNTTECLSLPHCRQCLEAINASFGNVRAFAQWNALSVPEVQSLEKAVNGALLFHPSCTHILVNGTDEVIDLLQGVMSEMQINTDGPGGHETNCTLRYGMSTTSCTSTTLVTYAQCVGAVSEQSGLDGDINDTATPNDCLVCLRGLFGIDNGVDKNFITVSDAVASPKCEAIVTGSPYPLDADCVSFPTCSVLKYNCRFRPHSGQNSYGPECASCLSTLEAGDGAGAARQCGNFLNGIVTACSADTSVACSYWKQMCASNSYCSTCLQAMGNEDSAEAIFNEYSSDACAGAFSKKWTALNYLGNIAHSCTNIGPCRRAVSQCVVDIPVVNPANQQCWCVNCLNLWLNGTDSQDPCCQNVLPIFHFDDVCRPCPESVLRINTVAHLTAIVGGVSLALCLGVVATIVAHGRDRVSMRERIVIGLMMMNGVYSAANIIPLNTLHTGVNTCGQLVMPFDVIRLGRAWWFFGKYGIVSFELLIVGASIRALVRGQASMPLALEGAMHIACVAVAMLAFGTFYVLCERINATGYNSDTESTSVTNSYNHFGEDDDENDVAPNAAASQRFESGRASYDSLLQDMLLAWNVVVGVVIVLWIVLRLIYHFALRELKALLQTVATAEGQDLWATTRRSAWNARQQLVVTRRDVFAEVVTPMEPYIVLFIVFSVPAFVMSTSYCKDHSDATTMDGAMTKTPGGNIFMSRAQNIAVGSSTLAYGACDVWCEFALAFRSMATVLVYLLPSRKRRAEFVSVCTTIQKLWARAIGSKRSMVTAKPDAPEGHHQRRHHPHGSGGGGGALETDALLAQQPAAVNVSINDEGDHVAWSGAVATTAENTPDAWHIAESNVIKDKVLGSGAFGQVWSGRLLPSNQPVAVKVLLAGSMVDEDGDSIDPNVDEDFHRECAALQRVSASPYLITFFGFGTTEEGGNGFIVTELMDGGSLEDTLHNPNCDLPWRLRIKFATHVALGMNYLHTMHMLHRDLKSANILLDKALTQAKVCDFGMARVVRPSARPHIVYSPFTGVTRLLPPTVDINEGQNAALSLSCTSVAVDIVDERGTMTKASGTLQWMAPEVFRGDQNYGKAADVYSFGIVMWELATRKIPWKDDIANSDIRVRLFQGLNRALQTGTRPTIPDSVRTEHASFVAIMQRCWEGDPANRLAFSQVLVQLAACLCEVV
eukprot:m.73591 g.73591  ORF g.73591 m.73591 type:complete len:1221 (+) comp8848_c0_seq1:376-4038(+)